MARRKIKTGRPLKLTPKIIAEVGRLIPVLMYLESVSDYIGVERSTWRRWAQRGKREADRLADDEGAEPLESEALYLEFFNTKKRAMAEGERRDCEAVAKAAQSGIWQAAAWRLERRFPEKWGTQAMEIRELVKECKKEMGEAKKEFNAFKARQGKQDALDIST